MILFHRGKPHEALFFLCLNDDQLHKNQPVYSTSASCIACSRTHAAYPSNTGLNWALLCQLYPLLVAWCLLNENQGTVSCDPYFTFKRSSDSHKGCMMLLLPWHLLECLALSTLSAPSFFQPTSAHMAIAKLVNEDKVKFVVSQNIDGLHLRSGLKREKIAELHGNMFIESCNTCKKMFVRSSAATTGMRNKLTISKRNIQEMNRICLTNELVMSDIL